MHTHTHAHKYKHNLDFSADYGVQPPLFMSEFDSHQILLHLLLCYALLVWQLYFRFKFLLVFIDYIPFWFLISDWIWPNKNEILVRVRPNKNRIHNMIFSH